MTAPDHGQTVYDTHHAVMHEQAGRRQSHHKSYDNLTPAVRARYDTAGQAVAGPLEAEIADLRLRLDDALDGFHFERKQVVALRSVLVEVFTCMETGDPALVFDDDQIALWRENAGMPS